MELDYRAIGKRIRKARKARQITQRELAEKIDVCAAHISNIEMGKKPLSLPTLVSICNALNVTADNLLVENYINVDQKIYNGLLTQIQCDSMQQMDLTMRMAEVISTWWQENHGDEM